MTTTVIVEHPTPEKIQEIKRKYARLGYVYVGEADTSMHLENSNSYMKSTPSTTLYFEQIQNY